MNIVIPTYRRTDEQFTYFALAKELRKDVVLVVRGDEYRVMSAKYPSVTVLQLPDAIDNLPSTRQFIWETFSGERFVMADDDIQNFYRRTPVSGSFDRGEVDQMTMMLELEKELDLGAGMSSPAGNWLRPNMSSGRWPTASAGPCGQFMMIDGPRLTHLGLRWDRVKRLEDNDFQLQILSHGIDTVVRQDFVYYTLPIGTAKGGLNLDGRDARMADELACHKILSDLWPEYVRMSKKHPGHYSNYRAKLLKDSRMKNMADDDDIQEVTEPPRRKRGRPLGSGQSFTEKITIGLPADEMRKMMIAAASDPSGPMKVQDWARKKLLALIDEEEED